MTLKELFYKVKTLLNQKSIDNSHQESLWILQEIGNFSYAQFILKENQEAPKPFTKKVLKMAQKRAKGHPLAYLLKNQEFAGFKFYVNSHVLIPRPETQGLLNWGVKNLKPQACVLEMGVGSGCFCVSLKKLRPDLTLWGSDISKKALEVAQKNANNLLDSHQKITFLQSNLFSKIKNQTFDGIFFNPPYLSKQDMKSRQKEFFFEPKKALLGGKTGYEFYHQLATQAPLFLNPQGVVGVEIGIKMEEQVAQIFQKQGFVLLKSLLDENNILRVLIFAYR